VDSELVNPAKPNAKPTTAIKNSTPIKPVTPSAIAEPTVLVKRTPRTYDDVAAQRTSATKESAVEKLDVVNTLARVSAISENQLVQRHVQTGFALAQRGAYYSAKSEFEQALRVIAESLDAQQVDGKHSEQLTAAFDAIAEADAFFVDDPRTSDRMNLRNVAITHHTPLLEEGKLEGLNQVAAMQAYYAYAQEQLRAAVGGEAIAAEALYGLGRTYTALAGADGTVSRLHGPKSLLMHQVAAQVNPQHPLAANELGVLLARFGQWEEAKQALLQTPKEQRLPESWHNLAVVHQRLGEQQLADAAQRECIAAQQAQQSDRQIPTYQENGVEWYDVSAAEKVARQQAPAENTTPHAAANPASSRQWPWSTPR
jgi:tetratricopeptide (TPR) repeat protein